MSKQSSNEQANYLMSNKARVGLTAALIFVLIWSLSFRDAKPARAQTTTEDETYIIRSPTRSGVAQAAGAAPEQTNGTEGALLTFTVANADDTGTGSLRQAILDANVSGGTDDITFSNTFFNTPRTINLAGALPIITESVNINGPSANLLTVQRDYNAATDFRIFDIVNASNVSISGMTINNGRDGFGGGIKSNGNLTLTRVHIAGNYASLAGGGVFLEDADGVFTNCTFSGNSAVFEGGGIYYRGNDGRTLQVVSSTISGNSAGSTGGGGIINLSSSGNSRLEVTASTIAFNTAQANGGGIRTFTQSSAGSTAITALQNTIIANNTVTNLAIGTSGGGATTVTTNGWNLSDNYNSIVTPMGTDKTGQPLLGPLSLGGGQTPTHALLGGSPALNAGDSSGTTQDQRGLPRVFGSSADIGAVEMQAIIVTTNADPGDGVCDATCTLRDAITAANTNGAGLDDIIFSNSIFNTAQTINLANALPDITSSVTINGPGAHLLTVRRDYNAATDFRIFTVLPGVSNVAICGMTISNGRDGNSGGGILSLSSLTLTNVHVSGNQANGGGGVGLVGSAMFTNCTFSGNTATSGGGINFQGRPGDVLRLENSTVSGNTATNAGAGIDQTSFSGNNTMEVVNSTIVNNTRAFTGGGIRTAAGTGATSTTRLRNSIVAGNTGNNLSTAGPATITSQGFNLSDDWNSIATVGTDLTAPPLLGPLSLNGGETPTHALLAGSPALDKGNRSGSTGDQRRLVRPFDIATLAPPTANDDNADIGAVEMQALVVTTAVDPGDDVCDATCSLRDAITAANANGPGLDDIIFSSTVGPTINLATALPNITSSLTMNGPGANLLTVRRDAAAANFRVFNITLGGGVAISGMAISNGNATAAGPITFGGGILSTRNLTLTNVTVLGNQATLGAGVSLAFANGTFTNSTFSGNTAGQQGGGINFQGDGGRKLRLVNSTVSSNITNANGLGGGVTHVSGTGVSTLEVTGSTIANNTGGAGGGIYTFASAVATAATTLHNSIIANNTPDNLVIAENGTETITSQGFNLSDNGNGFLSQPTDITATPLLDALADNGGPTQTHALLAGSPAIDAGNNSGSGVLTDQRGSGFARPVDLAGINNVSDGTDIGAFEAQTAPAPVTLLQFSAASYGASEASRTVEITVTRHGPTAGSSSIDYATSDGTATQVKDFTVAVGRFNFAPGETSKSFVVIITDDRFNDDSEKFIVTLSNPVGAALVGTLTSAQVTIEDNDTADGPSPVKAASFDSQFFVRQHYADFLNRVPDAGGLAFWVGQTTGCGNADLLVCRINVSAAFFLSIEFQETGYYAIRARRVAFAKKSDELATRVTFAQFIRDARQIGEGFVHLAPGADVVLEANKQAFASQIVTSPEFIANFPTSQTAAQYAAALYAKAGVTPTSTETQQAIDAFNAAGGSTAGRIAAFRKVTDSTSVRDAEFRGAFVLLQYFGYMRRDPDQPGYAFWLGKLNQFNGNFITAEMVKAFITSIEYEERFGL